MLHATNGIVLRTIKYGDTSIIVTIYTEVFGVQSYLVNGVRTDKKSKTKANIYQPATLLELVVYHQPNKNLQRIKEARVYYLYQSVQSSVVKNAIAIYMSELIFKTITEPEQHQDLYDFFESSFQLVDINLDNDLADFPIQFTIEMAARMGFGMQLQENNHHTLFDLMGGRFVALHDTSHTHLVTEEMSMILANMLKSEAITLNHDKRQELLSVCIQYLRLHIPHMSELKSPEVLHAVMS